MPPLSCHLFKFDVSMLGAGDMVVTVSIVYCCVEDTSIHISFFKLGET